MDFPLAWANRRWRLASRCHTQYFIRNIIRTHIYGIDYFCHPHPRYRNQSPSATSVVNKTGGAMISPARI